MKLSTNTQDSGRVAVSTQMCFSSMKCVCVFMGVCVCIFSNLTRNIRQRRGEKVVINVPSKSSWRFRAVITVQGCCYVITLLNLLNESLKWTQPEEVCSYCLEKMLISFEAVADVCKNINVRVSVMRWGVIVGTATAACCTSSAGRHISDSQSPSSV